MSRFALLLVALASAALLAACGSSRRASVTPITLPSIAPGGNVVVYHKTPRNWLIVLGHSIGGIRLSESRASVETALGTGTSLQRGWVSYLGGRLVVNYWLKQDLTTSVEGIETRWSRFDTRSGIRVGASRARLSRIPHMICGVGECSSYLLPRQADGPVNAVTTSHGMITDIRIFYG